MRRRTGKRFSAQVEEIVRKHQALAVQVLHESAAGVAEAAMLPKDEGGNMPVLFGNLRNSLAASRQGPPPIKWRGKDASGKHTAVEFADNSFQLQSEITATEIGQTLYLGFQAPYAHKAEKANGFVRLTAQRWPQIVADAVKTVKER